MFIFNVHLISESKINEMIKWCSVNLKHSDDFFYGTSWHFDEEEYYFEFTDEQDFIWFKLRWEDSHELYS